MFGISVLALAIAGTHAGSALRCEVRKPDGTELFPWSLEHVQAYVDSATRIVRLRATGGDSAAHTVTFEPLEWLRGAPNDAQLVLPGVLVDKDDYNPASVPYNRVRPSGLRGSCIAEQYRLGAQYLLLLRDGTRWSPVFWWPLGPVNEQLRGDDDPWLAWVRGRVAARKGALQ